MIAGRCPVPQLDWTGRPGPQITAIDLAKLCATAMTLAENHVLLAISSCAAHLKRITFYYIIGRTAPPKCVWRGRVFRHSMEFIDMHYECMNVGPESSRFENTVVHPAIELIFICMECFTLGNSLTGQGKTFKRIEF